MKKFIKNNLIIAIALLFNMGVFAQLPGEPVTPGDPDPTDAAPIGDYIWVVALIGLIYVFYKMRSRLTLQSK